MEARGIDIVSKGNSDVRIKIIPGHFATSHSHVNYYIDMTGAKCQHTMAKRLAGELAAHYNGSLPVDSIVCMDSTEMIGAFLADAMAAEHSNSPNAGKDINIITPEFNSSGQMIFRDNTQRMVWGKDILLLVASATTGKTINRALECIRYYNGTVSGISAIFSAIDVIGEIKINHVFGNRDIADYQTFKPLDCPYCNEKRKIDAIVNSYGYSKL